MSTPYEKSFRERLRASEEGAALLIAMLAIVLMTVIGTVLLTVLRNGFVNAHAAEAEIQAEMLAQNGLDEALGLIYKAVNRGNAGTDYLSRSAQTRSAIKDILNSVNDGYEKETARGKYTVSFMRGGEADPEINPFDVEDDKLRTGVIEFPNQAAAAYPPQPYVHQIVIKSVGETTNVQPKRTVTKLMKVYVSTINPVFRYPLSAANSMTLNGSPYIKGDVLVRNENTGYLLNTDKASFKVGVNGNYQVTTSLPYLQGFIHVISGRYYKDSAIGSPSDFNPAYFSSSSTFSDTSLEPDTDIEVGSTVNDLLDAGNIAQIQNGGAFYNAAVLGGYFSGARSSSMETSMPGRNYQGQWLTVDGDLQVKGNLVVDEGVFTLRENSALSFVANDNSGQPGIMYVKYSDPDLVAANLSGSLTVPEGQYVLIEGNAVLKDFTFSGKMFVKGELKIIGDLKVTDGSIYVDGNVELKEMDSINQDANQPVIIATSGKFVMADNLLTNESATNNQNKIRAFLYSRQDLHLYGVASRLQIIGGVHGNNVELNAVRGDITRTDPTAPPGVSDFDANQTGLAPDTSRLKVIYDDNLYLKPPNGIPVTDKVNVFVKEIVYPDRYH